MKTFIWRITAAHIITYTIAGAIAYQLLHYEELFATPPFSWYMKPTNSVWVAAGPVLQIIRGLIFSIVLWPFREVFLQNKFGWLKLWLLIVGLSILSTAAAATGSVEGFIYTNIPFKKQVIGYWEVMPQTLAFSIIVFYWYKYPVKAWNFVMGILVFLVIAMGIMGIIFRQPA